MNNPCKDCVSAKPIPHAHSNIPPEEKDWEKEFNEEWSDAGAEYPNRKLRIKSFIATLLKAEREKIYAEGYKDGNNVMNDQDSAFKEGKRAVLQELRSYVEGFGYVDCSTNILSEIKRLEDTV